MSAKDWDKLRNETYEKYNFKCAICKDHSGKLNCHEIWEYDDIKLIQTLKGFIALCNMCHHVKHIGLAKILADEGKLDYDAVIDHFIRVNKCDKETFNSHVEEAFIIWSERSSHKWKYNLGKFATLVKPHK